MRKLAFFLCALAYLASSLAPARCAPGSPYFETGMAAFMAGNYPQAADLFARDVTGSPQDALTHYYYGVSLHCLARYPEATREYNWVLLNSQDVELIKRVQLGLQSLARVQIQAKPQATAQQPPAEIQPAMAVAASYPAKALPVKGKSAEQSPAIGATGKLRIVDIYTPWCGYCKKFEPLFKKAQTKYTGRIAFESVDAQSSANKQFVNTYKIESYPTILLFTADGQLVKRINGAPPTMNDFEREIAQAFPTAL